MWNMKVTVVSLVVGALVNPAKSLEKRLETIDIETKITELQNYVLIHSSRILQKFIEVSGGLLTPCIKKYNKFVGRNKRATMQ